MKSNRNRMKMALRALVCAALLGGSAAAAVSEDAGIIGFSTTGPDRYADGTTVLDGETARFEPSPAVDRRVGIIRFHLVRDTKK